MPFPEHLKNIQKVKTQFGLFHGRYYTPTKRPNHVGNDSYIKLRDLLVEARKTVGLTQADLALRLKRPQSFVSKYERGERRLDIVEFGEVADALKIDPVRFLRRFYSGEA